MSPNETSEPTRLTSRGAATKSRIVEAAANLVGQRGVAATSLDDIMAASEVSKSQLYHYFADKDDLVQDVIGLQTERVFSVHRPLLAGLDSLPALRRWRDAVLAAARRAACKGGCPIGSLANELADQSEAARLELALSFDSWRAMIADGVRLMALRGDFRPDTSHEDLATAMLSAIQGGLLLGKTTRTVRPLEIALDMAIEHLMRHLARPQ